MHVDQSFSKQHPRFYSKRRKDPQVTSSLDALGDGGPPARWKNGFPKEPFKESPISKATQICIIFTPNLGEMIQFDEHIFQMGWFNHQPGKHFFLGVYGVERWNKGPLVV